MDANLFQGALVRLTAAEPKEFAEAAARWNQDSEYQRLSMLEPANMPSVKKLTEGAEKDQEKDPPSFYYFAIRTLESERIVGSCGLGGELFPHGEGYVGIGIGERALWDKGFGTDAMMVLLSFGFRELNLRRIALTVSDFNQRAIRSYEKAGFVLEGKVRGAILREGQRSDMVFMGIARDEWLAKQSMYTENGARQKI